MRERPILFSTEMVKAILDGRKTQTRRIVKQLKNETNSNTSYRLANIIDRFSLESIPQIVEAHKPDEWHSRYPNPNPIICKYGQVSDILWVRETWGRKKDIDKYFYKADYESYEFKGWKPSIHMPKEACRLRLRIKSIRIERLQEISEKDAIAEGIELIGNRYKQYLQTRLDKTVENPIYSYMTLWESINGIGSWEKNPYAWVIEFERVK